MRLTRPQPVAGSGTPIGLPDRDTGRWLVDGAGGLAPAGARWAVEWWVQAEDRWHVLSRDGTARQRLVGPAPVVETRQHVPGGDVVVTQWAVVAEPGSARVAVEIANESGDAVAVAAVLRPSGPGGSGGLRRVSLAAGRLVADAAGGPAGLEADLPPAHMAWPESPGAGCDSALLTHASHPISDTAVSDPQGRASGAVIWPLARQGSLRLRVTVGGGDAAAQGVLADAAATTRAWAARTGRHTRIEWPESPLATAIEANRHRLLLAPGWAGMSPAGEALTVDALASAGFADEARTELARLWSGRRRPEAPALWAAARLGSEPAGALGSSQVVGEAAEAVGRSLSGAASADDLVWAVAGLQAAADLLARLDEEQASAAVAGWIERALGRIGPGLPAAAAALAGHLGVPALASGRADIDGLADPVHSLFAAAAGIRLGEDPTGTLGALLAAAGPTWSGPQDGRGWDPQLPAAWWAVARSLLVDDRNGRLDLFPAFPAAWQGHAVEVHGLRTSFGPASWVLRWHGRRPALLWDIEGRGPIALSAPALDRSWSARSRTGEALLQV